MKWFGSYFTLLAAVGGLSVATATNFSLPEPVALDFGSGVIGALHRPEVFGPKAGIVVYVMHAESDYMQFTVCKELQKRGYTVLCVNNAASKWGTMSDIYLEGLMSDVAEGVTWLRNQSSVDKIVLWGHSGGGAMLSAYQNIAENGASACNGSEKIYPCSDTMNGLPPADGVMLVDANYGLSTMYLLSLNPAIEDESNGYQINETISLYNPASGFTTSGANYTAEFAKAYFAGVSRRNNRIIDFAVQRLAAINNGTGLFSDDEPLYVPDAQYGVDNNKFFSQDVNYLSRTTYAWPLLKKGGNVTTEVVQTVRVPVNFESMADQYMQGALKTTITRFLPTFAIRTAHDFAVNATGFAGIDWDSSSMVPRSAVKGITVPLLAMGMTGHWEFLNAESIYLASPSSDKSIAFVEGAQHTINTCTDCEKYSGEFGDTLKTAYDHMAGWLGEEGRFL